MSEVVSRESFKEWEHHPVTKKLKKLMQENREAMKEGLVNNSFENEDEVKGRCRVIAIFLNLEYEDMFDVSLGDSSVH